MMCVPKISLNVIGLEVEVGCMSFFNALLNEHKKIFQNLFSRFTNYFYHIQIVKFIMNGLKLLLLLLNYFVVIIFAASDFRFSNLTCESSSKVRYDCQLSDKFVSAKMNFLESQNRMIVSHEPS
jgi:hypothetical protein